MAFGSNLVATWAMNINTNPTTDPDMVLGSSLGADITMALGDNMML